MHIYQWVTEEIPHLLSRSGQVGSWVHRLQTWHICFGVQWGATDLKAHMDTKKHKKAVRGESSWTKLTEFFVRPGKSEDALLKKAFPDSDTAKKFNSARTKTEAIVNGVLAPHSVEVSREALKLFLKPVITCWVTSEKPIWICVFGYR